MDSPRPQLFILADGPDAFCNLFGISLLERLLRIVQRLGFREAIILSNSVEEVRAHLTKPSWARADVGLSVGSRNAGPVQVSEIPIEAARILVVSAGLYYDARLLKTMAKQDATTLLVDSAPTRDCSRLWKNGGQSPVLLEESSSPPRSESFRGAAALIEREWLARQEKAVGLFAQLFSDATVGRIDVCDAALHETYVVALRKHVRPVFFPAPSRDLTAVAERFPRDVAQNGVLDIPGFLDSPIEDWIVARLCRTSITPNQVTLITMLIGLGVTVLFLTGHLWWGAALAYTIEVLDGVDGKLARTKIETTATGEWEHVVDYCVELSWWTALAYHFHGHGVPSAYWLLLLLFGSDLIDRLAKRVVKKKVGRNLDDVAGFDRFVRWIGSRRNINIWILIIALILGGAAHGFVFFCWWGAITAAAHVVRAFQIRLALPPGRDTGAAW